MNLKDNLAVRIKKIKSEFKSALGYELNLDNPKSFNEKIQWIKLYYNDPLMTKCADKYLVREYIKEKIGEEYLIPLLGVWDRAEDIDFDSLPNQFVLKTNWGWAQNIIVKDKSSINIQETIHKLNDWLQPYNNMYYSTYEWQYKNIKPKIICEKYLEQIDNTLNDYKVFCFNGNPLYIQVDVDRFTNHKRTIYDINWNEMNFTYNYNKCDSKIKKPIVLDKILKLSKILSSSFNIIRIDFYIIDEKIIIGELTFTSENGMGKFDPVEYDYKLGNLIELPKEKKIEYLDYIDVNNLLEEKLLLDDIVIQYKQLLKKINSSNKKDIKKEINIFSIHYDKEKIIFFIFGIKITLKIGKSRAEQSRAEQSRAE